MARQSGVVSHGWSLCAILSLFLTAMAVGNEASEHKALGPGTGIDVKSIPFKIVYESLRKEGDKQNWELILINADGSNPVNLTKTPDISEIYPHASPDGTKVCFEANEGTDKSNMVRSVYYMNIDGTNRVKVAHNARQPCWGPDGRTIAFLKSEFDRYNYADYATKGVYFYDLKTGKTTEHSNCANLHHLYNLCLSPDGKWFTATVHGGMGFKHADLAFPAQGPEVFDLTPFRVTGCRPDFSPDGKRITWGATDWDLFIASIDFSSGKANVTNVHQIVKCDKEHEVYHTDWSPDGKYVAFSYGPEADEMGGGLAPGWNICISDLSGKWVQVTTDGNHNKEPDWVPVGGLDTEAISCEKRMQLYRDGEAKPAFVIPFEQLGPRWKAWQKHSQKGRLGYYAKKDAKGIGVGFLPMGSEEIVEEEVSFWDWTGTDKQGSTTTYKSFLGQGISHFYNLALGRASLTTKLVTCLQGQAPTADGSLLAFKTDGLELVWLNFMTFVSEGDDTLYFGVVDRQGGLVHLGGRGKCTLRTAGNDDVVTTLK